MCVLIVLGDRYSSLAISRGVSADGSSRNTDNRDPVSCSTRSASDWPRRRGVKPPADRIRLSLPGHVTDPRHQHLGDVQVPAASAGRPSSSRSSAKVRWATAASGWSASPSASANAGGPRWLPASLHGPARLAGGSRPGVRSRSGETMLCPCGSPMERLDERHAAASARRRAEQRPAWVTAAMPAPEARPRHERRAARPCSRAPVVSSLAMSRPASTYEHLACTSAVASVRSMPRGRRRRPSSPAWCAAQAAARMSPGRVGAPRVATGASNHEGSCPFPDRGRAMRWSSMTAAARSARHRRRADDARHHREPWASSQSAAGRWRAPASSTWRRSQSAKRRW